MTIAPIETPARTGPSNSRYLTCVSRTLLAYKFGKPWPNQPITKGIKPIIKTNKFLKLACQGCATAKSLRCSFSNFEK